MKFKSGKKELIEFVITIFLIIFSGIHPIGIKLLSIWMIVISIEKIIKTKDNLLVVIQLFMLLYCISPFIYFVLGIEISTYQNYDVDQYENMLAATQIQSLFLATFLLKLPIYHKSLFGKNIPTGKREIAWFVTAVVMIMCFFVIDWGSIASTIFTEGYTVERTGSILTDYFVIFSLVNYQYSNTKGKKAFNIFLTITMAIASLLTGTRISAIMLFILVFALNISSKISKKLTICAAIGGILLMNSFQYIRVFEVPTFSQILLGDYNSSANIVRSNAGDVWYCSEAIYKLIDNGTFDIAFRIKSFLGTFLNSFLPTSLTPDEALVNVYITENRLTAYPNNGGLIGVSTYLWLGYLGTFVAALLLAKLISLGYKKHVGAKAAYISLLVIVTLPKWYTYNPRILFKFAFVGLVFFLGGKILASLSVRRI